MFGIFSKKKKKPSKKKSAKPTREQIKQQALANARKARAELGEENIQRMAEALKKLDNPNHQSQGKQARDQIQKMDKKHVAQHVQTVLHDENN